MDDDANQSLREMRQTFKAQQSSASDAKATSPAEKALRVKTFKSGNSMALRLPAALGLKAGVEMELTVNAHGGYSLMPVDAPKRKIDISKFAGKCPWLEPLPRYDFEDSPRVWDDPDWPGWASVKK